MPDSFNAYQKWLGIPPKDQPPHYYRLLGLDTFESDRDAIAHAADRQMAHVRTFQSGPYSDLSQQLLNEISAAKLCLLNDQRKAAYDADLQGQLASVPSGPTPPPFASSGATSTTTAMAGDAPAMPATLDEEPPSSSTAVEAAKLAGVGLGSAALAALVGLYLFGLGPFAPDAAPPATHVGPKSVAEVSDDSSSSPNRRAADGTPESFEPAFPERPLEPAPADIGSDIVEGAAGAETLDPESLPADNSPGTTPQPENTSPNDAPVDEASAAGTSPAPNEPSTAEPSATVPPDDGTRPPGSTPDGGAPAEPAPMPAEPDQASEPSLAPEDNGFFAGLLAPPREKLPAPSDEEVASLLKELRATFQQEYSAAQSDAQQATMAGFLRDQARMIQDNESLRYVIYQEAHAAAIASGSPRLAMDIVDEWSARFVVDRLARNADMLTELARTQRDPGQRRGLAAIALELAELAVRERRFDEAEKLATQARAVGGRDSEIRTRSIAATNVIKKARQEWGKIEAAIETLEQTPDDPEANLTYGRYLCLHEHDWEQGLPLLAKSSDESLKAAAAADIENPTESAAQIAVADKWYEVATSGETRPVYFQRAAHWYEQALDELVDLERVRVARRMETFPVLGPGGVIDDETELHVVGVESANEEVRVLFGVEGRPAVLVLTGNRAVRWQVEVQPGADLRGVILSGNFSQSVSGLPAGTRVAHLARGDGAKVYFHATSRNSPNYNDLQTKLRALTGRPVASFDGTRRFRGNPVFVGP